MNAFERWFKMILSTGQTGAVKWGMSPGHLMQLFGEPMFKLAHPGETETIIALFYECDEGTMEFNFDTDGGIGNRPFPGDELNSIEEKGNQKRIQLKRK